MFAGYDWRQFFIHRGALHLILLKAVRKRLGRDRLCMGPQMPAGRAGPPSRPSSRGRSGRRAAGWSPSAETESTLPIDRNSTPMRPIRSGVNRWRGTARFASFLTGASMICEGLRHYSRRPRMVAP
jgi:hypothetical protein